MTRRKVIFREKNGRLHVTPEFNGDKSEFEKFKSRDTCTKNWDEILSLFKGIKTLNGFLNANACAQSYYESCIAPNQEILTTKTIKNITDVSADEVYLAENGKIVAISDVEM